jgi:hypothetical protein
MLPAEARRRYGARDRTEEVIAFVRRAVVRTGSRRDRR